MVYRSQELLPICQSTPSRDANVHYLYFKKLKTRCFTSSSLDHIEREPQYCEDLEDVFTR